MKKLGAMFGSGICVQYHALGGFTTFWFENRKTITTKCVIGWFKRGEKKRSERHIFANAEQLKAIHTLMAKSEVLALGDSVIVELDSFVNGKKDVVTVLSKNGISEVPVETLWCGGPLGSGHAKFLVNY